MKFRLVLFLMSLTWCQLSTAVCVSETWKLAPDLPLREIKKELDLIPRQRVVQIAWGEMLRKDVAASMAVPLLRYLEGTEQKPAQRGYFKVLSLSVLPKMTASNALKNWPLRPKEQKTTSWRLKDLCSLYNSAK